MSIEVKSDIGHGPRGEYYCWAIIDSQGVAVIGEEQGNYAGGAVWARDATALSEHRGKPCNPDDEWLMTHTGLDCLVSTLCEYSAQYPSFLPKLHVAMIDMTRREA